MDNTKIAQIKKQRNALRERIQKDIAKLAALGNMGTFQATHMVLDKLVMDSYAAYAFSTPKWTEGMAETYLPTTLEKVHVTPKTEPKTVEYKLYSKEEVGKIFMNSSPDDVAVWDGLTPYHSPPESYPPDWGFKLYSPDHKHVHAMKLGDWISAYDMAKHGGYKPENPGLTLNYSPSKDAYKLIYKHSNYGKPAEGTAFDKAVVKEMNEAFNGIISSKPKQHKGIWTAACKDGKYMTLPVEEWISGLTLAKYGISVCPEGYVWVHHTTKDMKMVVEDSVKVKPADWNYTLVAEKPYQGSKHMGMKLGAYLASPLVDDYGFNVCPSEKNLVKLVHKAHMDAYQLVNNGF